MKNKFESKTSIVGGIILYAFFFLACISFLVYGLLLNDSRFDEVIMHYINRGKGINIKNK